MSAVSVRDEDLHAYVDRQLDAVRAQQVEASLEVDREAAAAARAYREQGRLLHLVFDRVLDEPLPERLLRTPRLPMGLPRLVAAMPLLLIGATLGWFLRDASEPAAPAAWPRHAAIAHAVFVPEVRHPVEVRAAEEAHLIGWLSKRLGHPIRTPKLAAHGFELLGGRLLPDSPRPGAQFMYQDEAGRRLTLYLITDVANRGSAVRYAREGSVHVFYWIDREVGYALSGELRKEEMLRIARSIHEQLDP